MATTAATNLANGRNVAKNKAKIIHLEGVELRTELRAAINAFGSYEERRDWRTSNAIVKRVASST